MHLFIAADRNYILGLAALLKSVDINASNDPHQSVNITLVSTGINKQQKEQLQNCCKYEIEWQEAQPDYQELLSLNSSKLAYVRLEPQKYTKEKERLIWLDSDTIVLGSLEPIWHLDLEGMPIAAAPNVWGNPTNPLDRSPYFNSGVLVYDMKLWAKEELSKKLLDNAKVNLWADHDQGALNSVLAGRWKQLEQIWNNHDTEDMSTKVMHFISRPKPWESRTPNKLWVEMLSQTPFKDELHKLQSNSSWISSFRLKYRHLEQWLREPTVKFKSYLKSQKR